MKKINLFLIVSIISLFALVNNVNAEDNSDVNLLYSNFYNSFDEDLDFYFTNVDSYNALVDYYNDNYSSDYPYYFISITQSNLSPNDLCFKLVCSTTNTTKWYTHALQLAGSNYVELRKFINSSDVFDYGKTYTPGLFEYRSSSSLLYNNGIIYNNVPSFWGSGNNHYSSNFSSIRLPSFTSSSYNITIPDISINENDVIPGILSLYDGSYLSSLPSSYITIDLNEHSYVVLSLKDYNEEEEFTTNVEVKGQYCLTPVYNFGLTERKDVLKGTQVDRCSPYYNDYTPVRTYILESDLENNAIYYLKAYDTTKENKVKVDTSIFNIHLIDEEDEDNPIVNINGRNYSILPYDELTDTSTKSEDEGYASGASSRIAFEDISFSDIFTSPLNFLKEVWSSIVKVFELVGMLVALLPEPVQYFFYISFTLAIVLGLIKIIL